MALSFKGTAKMTRRRRKTYRAKSRRGGRPQVSQSVKKYVKNTIHRSIENKQFVSYAQTSLNGNQAITLMPTLVQGVGSSQRIGNKVKIVKGNMRLALNLLPYNVNTNPHACPAWVKIWICSQKTTNSNSFTATSNFFQINNAAIGFQGQALDMVFPVNDDIITIHTKRQFKLGCGGTSNTFPGSNVSAFDNSSYCKYLDIPLGKYYKQLRFDDTASNLPINTNLWFVIQVVPANGQALSGQMANINYALELLYEDA